MDLKKQANVIAIIHLAWILWGVISLPLVIMVKGYENIALILIGITLLSWLVFRGCLFLQLENKLRKKDNPVATYEGAFVAHYANKFFGTHFSTIGVRIVIYAFMAILLIIALVKKF